MPFVLAFACYSIGKINLNNCVQQVISRGAFVYFGLGPSVVTGCHWSIDVHGRQFASLRWEPLHVYPMAGCATEEGLRFGMRWCSMHGLL